MSPIQLCGPNGTFDPLAGEDAALYPWRGVMEDRAVQQTAAARARSERTPVDLGANLLVARHELDFGDGGVVCERLNAPARNAPWGLQGIFVPDDISPADFPSGFAVRVSGSPRVHIKVWAPSARAPIGAFYAAVLDEVRDFALDVDSFAGNGARFDRRYDSTLDVRVVNCGTANAYAFEASGGGDPWLGNNTIWSRLRVEESVGLAVRMRSYADTVLALHSERARGVRPDAYTWDLELHNSTLSNVSLNVWTEQEPDARTRARIVGNGTVVNALWSQRNIDFEWGAVPTPRTPGWDGSDDRDRIDRRPGYATLALVEPKILSGGEVPGLPAPWAAFALGGSVRLRADCPHTQFLGTDWLAGDTA